MRLILLVYYKYKEYGLEGILHFCRSEKEEKEDDDEEEDWFSVENYFEMQENVETQLLDLDKEKQEVSVRKFELEGLLTVSLPNC